MLLAELEFHHSRKIAPTRRLALGNSYLPRHSSPGNGAMLLAGVVGRFLPEVDQEFQEEFHRVLSKVQRGERVAQPCLRHRFQEDTVGLTRTRHRLSSIDEKLRFSFGRSDAAPEQNVLAAAYVVGEFAYSDRPVTMNLIRKAAKWKGNIGADFISYLLGHHKKYVVDIGHDDSVSWALSILGLGHPIPERREIKQQFRRLLRTTHPDTGDSNQNFDVAQRISDLSEARRILLR
ncbi:MAG: J domain-containing protein [Acidimicrobiales bacterium]|nr:J domain-containing protein [Acidimicrobiales bacterium]